MNTNNTKMKTKITFVLLGLLAAVQFANTAGAGTETWTQKADMPTARWGLSTSVVDGKIYAIGGVGGSKAVEEYDPVTDTWAKKADIPTGRVFLASGAVNGKIYVIGGSTSWGGAALAIVEEYDPATDTWTQKADMPTPRHALTISVVNGRIYAIGGKGGNRKKVEEYDPVTDIWTEKADMPTGRTFHSTSVVNGKIYAVGGQPENTSSALSAVEEYDPITDTWIKKANMPVPRTFWSSSAVDDKIYSFGGNTSKGGSVLASLLQYDPATDTWIAKDDMPVRVGGLSSSVVDGRIYVIGGTSAPYPFDPPLSTVWEYDTGVPIPSPDFNGDGVVDDADVTIMVNYWHTDEPSCDLAPPPWGDGIVDVQDMATLMQYLGQDLDDPTLIAHWALDEAEGDIALDSVGGSNGVGDGYVLGNPFWLPTGGQVDGAIVLDGVDDLVITGAVLNPADGPFSILAWTKGGAPGQVVISEPSGSNWLSADPLEGCLMTELAGVGRSSAPLLSETVITDVSWHRIGLVWDGTHRMLYVDGIMVAQDTQDYMEVRGAGMYIGTGSTMIPGTYFAGLIDDVRIYNRAVKP